MWGSKMPTVQLDLVHHPNDKRGMDDSEAIRRIGRRFPNPPHFSWRAACCNRGSDALFPPSCCCLTPQRPPTSRPTVPGRQAGASRVRVNNIPRLCLFRVRCRDGLPAVEGERLASSPKRPGLGRIKFLLQPRLCLLRGVPSVPLSLKRYTIEYPSCIISMRTLGCCEILKRFFAWVLTFFA